MSEAVRSERVYNHPAGLMRRQNEHVFFEGIFVRAYQAFFNLKDGPQAAMFSLAWFLKDTREGGFSFEYLADELGLDDRVFWRGRAVALFRALHGGLPPHLADEARRIGVDPAGAFQPFRINLEGKIALVSMDGVEVVPAPEPVNAGGEEMS